MNGRYEWKEWIVHHEKTGGGQQAKASLGQPRQDQSLLETHDRTAPPAWNS